MLLAGPSQAAVDCRRLQQAARTCLCIGGQSYAEPKKLASTNGFFKKQPSLEFSAFKVLYIKPSRKRLTPFSVPTKRTLSRANQNAANVRVIKMDLEIIRHPPFSQEIAKDCETALESAASKLVRLLTFSIILPHSPQLTCRATPQASPERSAPRALCRPRRTPCGACSRPAER
jgi:hypothetical protein